MNSTASLLIISCMLSMSQLDIDADTNRDGRIDGSTIEEELEASQSVLILNNVDDDDRDGLPDNQNRVIDGKSDWEDLEPVCIRRVALPLNGEFRPLLTIEEVSEDVTLTRNRIRVFNAEGQEIIGPNSGQTHYLTADELRSLACCDQTIYVEGLKFRTCVRLLIIHGDEQDELLLETSPFILTPTTQSPKSNMVVDVGDSFSKDYIGRFVNACQAARVAPWIIHPEDASGESWIQDEIEWGYTQTARHQIPVVLQMFRESRPSGLQGLAQRLVRPGVGYFEVWNYGEDISHQGAHDSGGNLEVTPPVPGHPLGRVYFGSRATTSVPVFERRIDERFEFFFLQQGVQSPINLRTDWLSVGHVDEVVTFLPTNGGKTFVMLLASPRLGIELLHRMGDAADLDMRYWKFIDRAQIPAPQHSSPPKVKDLRDLKFSVGAEEPRPVYSFDEYNLGIDKQIFGADHNQPDPDSIKGIFMAELGLTADQIIEVPVLFRNEGSGWAAGAVCPNMVNLASMGEFCLVGEPFIPLFKDDFGASLQRVGLKPLWIDTWINFHVNGGNVHCSSNVVREPFNINWWKVTPPKLTDAPMLEEMKQPRSEIRPTL